MADKWTEEEEAECQQLWEVQKWTASQIATHFCRQGHPMSRNAVVGKVHRRGWSKPNTRGGQTKTRSSAPKPTRRAWKPGTSKPPQPVLSNLPPEEPEVIETEALPEEIIPKVVTEYQIADLTETMCRYPFGDPHKGRFFYCGAHKKDDPNVPYCGAHERLCWNGVPERRH